VFHLKYRTLGKTGLKISVLGYGCSPLGDLFGRGDMNEIKAAVAEAVERGVNYFDVSPYYGVDALAERRTGEALSGGLRQKVILATKVGQYCWNGEDSHDYSAKNVIASVEESLQRLKTDYIDVFQAHDIHFSSTEQIVQETIPAMRKLQQEGKIRFVGITDYGLQVLKAVVDRTEVDTVLSCACYNLIDAYNSQNLGMEFCIGCALEAGPKAFDLFDSLTRFQAQKRIHVIHFRNVNQPMPYCTETFLDNGYMNMRRVMEHIVKIGYDETLIYDHCPEFPAQEIRRGLEAAYSAGYIQALIDGAMENSAGRCG